VIDAVGVALRKCIADDAVQLARRGEISAERLLHDHAAPNRRRATCSIRFSQVLEDGPKLVGRSGEVEEAVPSGAPLRIELLQTHGEPFVAIRIRKLALVIKDGAREARPKLVAQSLPGMLAGRFFQLLAKLLIGLRAPANPTTANAGGSSPSAAML
jgi:hypothetical protein